MLSNQTATAAAGWPRPRRSTAHSLGVLCVAALAMSMVTVPAPAQTCGHWPGGPGSTGDPGTSGSAPIVYATAEWDPDGDGPLPRVLVAGGSFTSAGSALASRMAMYDFSTRNWLPFGAGTDGTVRAIVVLPDGSLAVGGSFQSAGGVPGTSKVARWTPTGGSVNSGTWSSFGAGLPVPATTVRSLAVHPNGDLFVGGWFSGSGATAAFKGILRWDGAAWSPLGSGVTTEVRSIAVMDDGSIIVGGPISQAGGVPVNNLARWDGVAWSPVGTPPNDGIGQAGIGELTVVVRDTNGDLIVGGGFSRAGTLAADGIARWRPSTGQWSYLVSPSNRVPWVYAILPLPNGELIATGTNDGFSQPLAPAVMNVARWNGQQWLSMNYLTAPFYRFSTGWSLTRLSNGNVVLGGDFAGAGGSPANNIAVFDFDVEAPLIDAHPTPATACHAANVPVSFTVSAVSPIAKTYQWQRNGVDIPRTGNATATTQTLVLPNPFGVDAGDYRCTVTTGCGSITSNAATLTICTADFDCSSSVTLDDLFIYLNAWFATDPRCNVDPVAGISLDDLFVFINLWFAGC